MPVTTADDGATLHWDELGTPSRPPLVLLTGQALDGRVWARTVPDLAPHFRLIVPHYRGIGRSSATFPPQWSTRHLARDIITVLNAAGLDRTHLWGFSLGGRAAQWVAAYEGARVQGLVLSSTTVGDRTGVRRPVWATRALFSGQRSTVADLFFTAGFVAKQPEWVNAAIPSTGHNATLRAHFTASRDHDGAMALPRITARTLVTHGAADVVCPPENGMLLAQRIPSARLRVTPQGRHGAHLEFPSTTGAVLRFLGGLSA